MTEDKNTLIELVERAIDTLAKDTLYVVVKHEMDALAKRDPSFAAIAESCKRAIISLEQHIDDESMRSKVVSRYEEIMNILYSISHSVTEYDLNCLKDCVSHLEEFIEIGANGGRK